MYWNSAEGGSILNPLSRGWIAAADTLSRSVSAALLTPPSPRHAPSFPAGPSRWRSYSSVGDWNDGSSVSGLTLGAASNSPGAGQRIGPYRLLERLGRGGQADVWRALRLEPSVMEVALKLVPEKGQDPRRIVQLRREAERGVRLANAGPGLVRAFAYGESDGLWFMAMPLVIGTTLAAILSRRRAHFLERDHFDNADYALATLPEPQYTRTIIGLIAKIARSLADAHAAQIVHRDIKPLNILVPRNYREGAYLCDFGLGRDLDVATPDQLLDGAGSPHYMAPERLLKTVAADEYRGEVFALGATLFEAITLTLPVVVPSGLSFSETVQRLADTEPLKPRQIRPELDPKLEALMLKAIARDPNDRHPCVSSFAQDLEDVLAND